MSCAACSPYGQTMPKPSGIRICAYRQGLPDEAIPVLEKALSVSDRSPAVIGVLVRAYVFAGRRADALRLLAELKRRRQAGYVPTAAFVHAYLGLGEYDEAFAWLSRLTRSSQTCCNS